MRFATVPAAFATAVAAAPSRPMLTWYDDQTGERVELSGATLGNWVAKTANLLVDEVGLAPGDTAIVDIPSHWQSAAVLVGCWTAGARVAAPVLGGPADPGLPAAATVVFAAADRAERYAGAADEVYGLALAPLAAPMREVPAGVSDYVTAVRQHGDHFAAVSPVAGTDLATSLTHQELIRLAEARATELGITAGARVLVDLATHPDPLDWLLAPLVTAASTVLCRALDPAAIGDRSAAEQVTLTLV
ncbi:TIGR03089 family protein [Natronosporangium hydrolyticum]|uniref:TIGR03089 family protein n=1 Tax=Natronosporangium hydrolyticum TaxID=2811111 RepID=A0A895YES4_9ACTN|nr:TIGR03089 family protein [Natronosporangium hydrolyticum]QSB13913.1 TIGR03089 family protein [Natronosporangium hydrolyticum]